MLFDELQENPDDMLFEDASSKDVVDAPEDGGAIPPPRETFDLLGHQDIERQLLSMLENKRFPHGLIFSGLEGVGKSVMAYRLARYLFAKDGAQDDTMGLFGDAPAPATSLYIAPTDPAFAQVASGGNPDLLLIQRPVDEKTGRIKGSVPVDEIRKIAPFMRKTAAIKNGWRIVIVDDADTMTRSSQNSLLKILEEPPEKSLLILVAHRAGALLPTIYSRCVHIPFAPLSDDVIRRALDGRCAGHHQMDSIVSMAEGSLGAAYEYADPQHSEVLDQTLALLKGGQKFSWTEIQKFADFFGAKGNDDAQRIFKETMIWVAGSLVRNRLRGFDGFSSLGLSQRLKIYDDLRAHFDRCHLGNLDKRFLIIGAYMVFEQ